MAEESAARGEAAPVRRLRRAERREQILDAAKRAFARTGFTDTSLDDVAAEAGVSRVILYRHFESKGGMYRAVLDRALERLVARVGEGEFTDASIPAFLSAAAEDPDGFRLVFHHAAREPEFRDLTDGLTAASTELALRQLAEVVPDPAWARWAAHLVFTVAVEGAAAWLDAGRPDPDSAAERVSAAVHGVISAARGSA
ncbi:MULTISPECIES: TetR/AcrR family transcriptional regulator [Nocardiopsis]|uniref:AcrR family transcriptional regulator n=1 Tax=Nocardiopsis sinuspersici TaxID=501010 RepID=A0A1V3C391_9ACTN|nr:MULTISPECIES: TetR/AcrR family transcriptional regulator [Nocardiopsis]NYH51463.1 AcrR family transcriptional regulator [Nocardiopsis sinuspersici]OOC55102.1 TetR family transcriptional regulator [Nocardiopsis sinuspersici]